MPKEDLACGKSVNGERDQHRNEIESHGNGPRQAGTEVKEASEHYKSGLFLL